MAQTVERSQCSQMWLIEKLYTELGSMLFFFKVHTFVKGHKILQDLHLNFDWHSIRQKQGEDFAKFCGLLRIYEL